MGKRYEKRPISAPGLDFRTVESHGSTDATLSQYGVSIITATATGLTYTLPIPEPGQTKVVSIDYTGATGSLTLAQNNTGVLLNGSTANTITAASSEKHLTLLMFGLTTSRWAVMTSTGSGVTFA